MPEHGEESVMGIRECGISPDGSLFPVAVLEGLTKARRSGPGPCTASIEPPTPKGRCSGAAKRTGSVRDFTPLPAHGSAARGGPSRLLPSLALLAAALVLWTGQALGQTVMITPDTAQMLQEGESFSVTINLAGVENNHRGWFSIGVPQMATPGKPSEADFEVYKQAAEPTPTDTPLTSCASGDFRYYPCSAQFDGSTDGEMGSITLWMVAKTDTIYFEPDEVTSLNFTLWLSDFSDSVASAEVEVTISDGPVPDPTGKPTTPANLMATAGKGAVTLTWDALDLTASNTNRVNDGNITKHQVRQTTDSDITDETWTDIPDSAPGEANDTSYTIGSLTDGTEYTFQVRAVNGCDTTTGCGNSDPATAVMATPDGDARARPTGLMATAGNTQATLTWSDPGDATITFYEYQQKEGSAAFGTWTLIPGSSATTTSYRLTGLDNGTAYTYRIRVGRGADLSLASDGVTVTPQGAPPAVPVLTATPRSGGVALSWPNPADSTIQLYEYQYKTGITAWQPWQTARTWSAESCRGITFAPCVPPYFFTDNATLRFPVGGLTNGSPHRFRIRAVNADGKTISNEASATPVAIVPAKPTGLTTSVEFDLFYRSLRWDRAADASILRYEYTTDEGRNWSFLVSQTTGDPAGFHRFARDEYRSSGYTFRIRAVNAAGPGPASEPAAGEEAETVATGIPASNVSLEWDSSTMKATLVWDETERDDLRGWSVYFGVAHDWNTVLPVGTTRHEIPGTFNGGAYINVTVAGCLFSSNCGKGGVSGFTRLQVGAPREAPRGFSATPGDAQITLAWDAVTDSSLTGFQYEVEWRRGAASGQNSIPDGDDDGNSAADETSHVVTAINNLINAPPGEAPVNGEAYNFRLRAYNAYGEGAWTKWIRGIIPLAAGVPAAPSGVAPLGVDRTRSQTTWDDPQDPSITGYQQWDGSQWQDIPGSDASTTGAELIVSLNFGRVTFRAVNANGVGPYAEARPVILPAPSRPTGLQAAPANGRVALSWDDPGKGVYIESWRYTTDGGETWTDIPGSETTVQGHLTRYTVPGLTNGQAYTFAVVAENSSGTSPASAAVTSTPRDGAPAKPTGLSAAPGDTGATLAWDNPTDASITKYQVKQGTANWVDISGSGAGTTSHTVGSLSNGTATTFQIRAVNDHNGDSTDDPGPASDAVTVTPGVPEAPASLSVAPGNAQVTLTWTAPASNNGSAVSGYEYTSNAGAATPTWTDVPDGSDSGIDRADETGYTVTSLTNNSTYAFAVRAENPNGQGAATPTRRAVPVHPDAPQQPALRAIPGHELVKLTWALPNFQHPVTSYQYRQSTNGGTTWSPDWTAITGSDADTTEHTLTSLANGTTYTIELRGLKDSTPGPAARAQATPSQTAGRKVITPETKGEFGRISDSRSSAEDFNTFTVTAPDGSTYTVSRLSLPDDLNWRITVPGTTDIDGRTFTLRSIQGTTPRTSSRFAFTGSGQEGLDIEVVPALAGPVQICLEPSALLRLEAGDRQLLILRYDGMTWTPLSTTYENGMVCANVTSFSAFVLGHEDPDYNRGPQPQGSIPAQTVVDGRTVEVNLAPYFTDENNDGLTYTAESNDDTKVTAAVRAGSSLLMLTGEDTGSVAVTVTATDPDGEAATQTVSVTVEANAAPVGQAIPMQDLKQPGLATVLVDLTRYFSDANGDALTFTAPSGDTNVVDTMVRQESGVLTLTAVNAGDATVEVTATDPDGAEGMASIDVRVTANAAPTVGSLPAQTLVAGRSVATPVNLADYFGDADNDPLTYSATSGNEDVVTVAVTGSVLQLTPGATAGAATVTVRAEDPAGADVSATMQVTAGANSSPTVVDIPAQTLVLNVVDTVLVPLNAYFSDPNKDPLTYSATSGNENVVTSSVAAATGVLTLTAEAASDSAVTVSVEARDPDGATVSRTISVTVSADPGEANVAPVATQVIPPRELTVGEADVELNLDGYFTDPNTDDLGYTAPSPDSDVLTTAVADNLLTLTAVGMGTVTVPVTASDPEGLQSLQGVTVTVRTPVADNRAPAQTGEIPPQTVAAGRFASTLDLTAYVTDPDNDDLTFDAVSQNDAVVAAAMARGNFLTLIGVAAGEATVAITAADPDGLQALLSVAVAVTPGSSTGPRTGSPAGPSQPADNKPPVVAQPIPDQSLVASRAADTDTDPTDRPSAVAAAFRTRTGPPVVVDPSGGVAMNLARFFHDPDGDPLLYHAESQPDGLVATAMLGSVLTLDGRAAGTAVITVTAQDPFGGSVTQRFSISVGDNTAPRVAQPFPEPVAAVGSRVVLDLTPFFEDPDGDSLTYAAQSDNPDAVMAEIAEGGSQLVLSGVPGGEAVITVTASDPQGGEVSQTLRVRTNSAPTVVQPVPAQVAAVGGRSELLDLAPYFHDPDADPLTYAAESDNTNAVTAEVPAGSSQLVLSGVAAGEAAITVTASDPHGGEVSQTFTAKANVGPAVLRPIPEQVVSVGGTSQLDLSRHFWGPGGIPLTYTATALGSGAILAEVPAGSSQLVLSGVSAGVAVVTVTASDPRGNEVSQTFTVITSSAPTVAQPIQDQVVTVGGTSLLLDLARYFHDPDGDPLTYAATAFGSGAVTAEVPAGSSQLVLSGVSAGVAVVTVTASDPHGGEVSLTFTVITNTAPTVVKPIPEQVVTVGGTSQSLDLAPYFHDPDGDALTYAAAIFGTGAVTATIRAGGSQLSLRGVSVGAAAIVVTASDPHGGEVSLTLTVRANAAPAVAQAGADGDPPTHAAGSDNAGVAIAAVPAGGSGPLLSGVAANEADIVVTGGDPDGGKITQALTLSRNSAPAVAQPIQEQVLAVGGTSQPLDLSAYFHDPDGDPLTYAAVAFGSGAVIAEVPAGSSRLTLSGVSAGEAVIVVTARDPHGGEVSQALTVRTNSAPTVAQSVPPQVVAVGGTSGRLDLAPYFHDPDGDPLTYAAESDNPGAVIAKVPAGSSQLVLSGAAAGEAVVVVTARDPYGGEASQTLTVRTNRAPTVARPIPTQVVTVGGRSESLDLAAYFHDPDGDPLAYAAESDNPGVVIADIPVGGSHLTLRGVAAGRALIIVTVSDPDGGEAGQTLTVRTNRVPTVAQPIPPQVVAVGVTSAPLDLAPYFHDPDGDPLSYTAESDNPGVVIAEVADGSRLVLIGMAAGEAAITITASDPYGGVVSQALTVRTNAAPAVAQPISPQVVAVGATSAPLDLAPYFHDPDGDPLVYTADSDNPGTVIADIPEGGGRLVLIGVAAGEAAITVTAKDPYGGEASQTLAARTNSAPAVAQPIPPQVIAVGVTSEPLDLAPYFHDPDGDPLAYTAESDNPEVMTAGMAGALFTVTGVAAGAAVATVTARDPLDAAVSQSVTVRVKVAQPAWVKAWVARFGRTVSGQVLDGVQDRLRMTRQAGFEATLAGHRVGGMAEDEAMQLSDRALGGAAAFRQELAALAGRMNGQTDHPASGGRPRQALTGRDLLTSTAFTLTGGNSEGGFGALWGRGAVSHFAGEDGALSLDGEVATGMLGADWVSGRWIAGLTLALSRGTGGYDAADGSGEIESMLTGLYPWVGYHFTERLSVWTALGYGAGVLTLTPQEQESSKTDMSLTLAAAGARSELLELPKLGGVMLAVETDARLTRTSTGATADLDATDATVWQVRLGLEGSRHIALEGGATLRPSIEVGLRHDGGDAETGSGVELGAGLSFTRPASGLSLDLAARRLLAHRAPGLEEWGASASLTWDPTPSSDRGLLVSLQQSVGASSSGGMSALLGRDTMAASPGVAGIAGASHLQARAGYGLPMGAGRFIGTPQLGFGLSDGRHDYTLGWHLSVARREEIDLTLGLEASRRENPDAGNPEHGVMLQLRLGH